MQARMGFAGIAPNSSYKVDECAAINTSLVMLYDTNMANSSLVPYHVLGPRVENQYIGETTNWLASGYDIAKWKITMLLMGKSAN